MVPSNLAWSARHPRVVPFMMDSPVKSPKIFGRAVSFTQRAARSIHETYQNTESPYITSHRGKHVQSATPVVRKRSFRWWTPPADIICAIFLSNTPSYSQAVSTSYMAAIRGERALTVPEVVQFRSLARLRATVSFISDRQATWTQEVSRQ